MRAIIERDIELMLLGANLLEMLPGGKWLSFVDAAHQFREALVSQLDLSVSRFPLMGDAIQFLSVKTRLSHRWRHVVLIGSERILQTMKALCFRGLSGPMYPRRSLWSRLRR